MPTDRELLQAYADGSQDAFGELVARHAGWVYGVAARTVGDRQLAEDITQTAFLILARKGPTLKEGTVVTAWLFRTVRLTALDAARRESRRRRREAAAATRDHHAPEPSWTDLAPLLDELIERLPARDRRAIALRFFTGRDFADVARELGTSEAAARKVVSRAVERLRATFARAGVVASAGAIESLALAHAADPHGASLVPQITASAKGVAVAKATALTLSTITAAAASVAVAAGVVWAVVAGAGRPITTATTPATTQIAAAVTSFDDVIAGVERAERGLKNVHVREFATTHYTRKVTDKDWTPSAERATGSAWFEGGPAGRARVYFAEHVSPWISGKGGPAEKPSAFVATAEDVGFDGKTGLLVLAKGTPGGKDGRPTYPAKMVDDNVAWISDGPPTMLDTVETSVATGRAFTSASCPLFGRGRASLSAFFRQARDRHNPPQLSTERLNGYDTVRLRWSGAATTVSIWIAPGKGFALVRAEMSIQVRGKSENMLVDVAELREAAPGVWYPTAARYEGLDHFEPGTLSRIDYRAVGVTADAPDFDPAIFTVKLSPGCQIIDQRPGHATHTRLMRDGTTRPIVSGTPITENPTPHRPPVDDHD